MGCYGSIDGNTVNMEKSIVKMTENIAFYFSVQVISKNFHDEVYHQRRKENNMGGILDILKN